MFFSRKWSKSIWSFKLSSNDNNESLPLYLILVGRLKWRPIASEFNLIFTSLLYTSGFFVDAVTLTLHLYGLFLNKAYTTVSPLPIPVTLPSLSIWAIVSSILKYLINPVFLISVDLTVSPTSSDK